LWALGGGGGWWASGFFFSFFFNFVTSKLANFLPKD
jgi:hypothetical protein